MKTAVLYTLKGKHPLNPHLIHFTQQDKCDLAASFQRAALGDVVKKILHAAKEFNIQTVILGGGVTNNMALRQLLVKESEGQHQFIWPSFGLSLDNAAMIAGLGYYRYQIQKKSDSMHLEPLVRIPFAK